MSRTTSMLGVVGVAVGLSLASVEPAGAQTTPGAPPDTFLDQTQNVVDGECPSSGPVPCVAGIVTSAGQVEVQNEGMAQYVVQRRLRALQCPPDAEAKGECSSQPQGGASADEESFLNGMSVFFSGDYENKNKDVNNFEAGFQSNKGGLTVGADKRLGTWGVAGAAISYGHTWGEFDHNDGDFSTDSIGTLIYGSYYPTDQSFIDATVGFAYKFYDVSRGFSMIDGTHQPVEAKGDTTGVEFNTSLSGGYDFTFGAFTVGPRLGLNYIQTHYDAFTENNNPLGLSYGDQKEDSLTTTAGVQMSYAISTDFGVVVPQVSAEYVHEFLNDQHTVHAVSAATPTVNVSYLTEKPDRDYAHVGAGVVFVLPEGYSPYLNYRAEVANSNETVQTVTVGLRLELE
jgi:outer membrane autotransporter protein